VLRLQTLLLPLLLLGPFSLAPAQPVARFRADEAAGEAALRLARQALDEYCLHRSRITVPDNLPPLLYEHAGVFVSAQVNGAPRCCMGTLRPYGPSLAADIIAAATLAAAHDTRFPPLEPAELPALRVIVSILDPPQAITDPIMLDPVSDGLAIRSSLRTGVVLPGETGRLDRFLAWALIRAGARHGERVQYFRLNAVRFIEPSRPAASQRR
jgi:AMMECR1 domain-containing protein